jgi:hypothetical protein
MEWQSTSMAVKPHELWPLTVPTCLPSRLTCQTHWEGCVKVMPTLGGGAIMASSIRWSLVEGHGPPRVGSSGCKADAFTVWEDAARRRLHLMNTR